MSVHGGLQRQGRWTTMTRYIGYSDMLQMRREKCVAVTLTKHRSKMLKRWKAAYQSVASLPGGVMRQQRQGVGVDVLIWYTDPGPWYSV